VVRGTPHEDLVSLISFYETDHDARITALDGGYPEVPASEYLEEKLDAITIA
jgi:hypothetical protein